MPAAPLHVLVPGQQGCGKGRNAIKMGKGDVPVPTSANAAEGPAEGEDGGYHCHLDPSTLAVGHVVDLGHILDGGATLQAASLPFDIDEHIRILGSTFRTL